MRMRGRRFLASAVALAGLAAATASPAAATAIVETAEGPVQGAVAPDHRAFRGIPYAAPPVGPLRWKAPEPVARWTAVRDAFESGSRCPQLADGSGVGGSENEDCLYLDVVTPTSATPAAPKPVMVWLHGGGGTGSGNDYDARRLATGGDVVVVTVNYRLGIFGFLAHPQLPDSGAFGLQDQQAALRWVQRNAAAFGGDPANVTLFGESSGGVSACLQQVSPTAAGLFHRVIAQSGTCTTEYPADLYFPGQAATFFWRPLGAAEGDGTLTAQQLGCADPATVVACLRAAPVSDLLTIEFALPLDSPGFVPVYGVDTLPLKPSRALRLGQFHHVPTMSGITRDEGRSFGAPLTSITEQGYADRLAANFGDDADEVAAEYPVSDYDMPGLAWADVVTDRTFALGVFRANRRIARHMRVHAFEFADRDAPPLGPDPGYPLGAYHGSEVPYLFDIVGLPVTLTPTQEQLSQDMIRYWARFATTGNPNGPGLPDWPRYRNRDAVPYVQSLAPSDGGGIGPVDFVDEHKLDFWRALLAQ